MMNLLIISIYTFFSIAVIRKTATGTVRNGVNMGRKDHALASP